MPSTCIPWNPEDGGPRRGRAAANPGFRNATHAFAVPDGRTVVSDDGHLAYQPIDSTGALERRVRYPGVSEGDVPRRLPYPHITRIVIHMKTTLNIDDTVMRHLREEAVRRETTMTALVEAGLRLVLADGRTAGGDRGPLPELPSWKSGGQRVDISNREELYRAMEDG